MEQGPPAPEAAKSVDDTGTWGGVRGQPKVKKNDPAEKQRLLLEQHKERLKIIKEEEEKQEKLAQEAKQKQAKRSSRSRSRSRSQSRKRSRSGGRDSFGRDAGLRKKS